MLPKLPYTYRTTERTVSAFRGLNLTENRGEGEFSETAGLNTAHFPALSQDERRKVLSGYKNPTDIYAWNGKFCVVDGGVLYYDGEPIENVSDTPKQFSVVNTKLCIFPDKLWIDTNTGKHGHLDASIRLSTNGRTLTANSVTAPNIPLLKSGISTPKISCVVTDNTRSDYQSAYIYGSDPAALQNSYRDGVWHLEELTEELVYMVPLRGETHGFQTGMLFIPKKSGNVYSMVLSGSDQESLPDKSLYSTSGEYGRITDWTYDEVSAVGAGGSGDTLLYRGVRCYFDIYTMQGTKTMSDFFDIGDTVCVESPYLADIDAVKISSMDELTNTVTFEKSIFPSESFSFRLYEDGKDIIPAGNYYFQRTKTYNNRLELSQSVGIDEVLLATRSNFFVWNKKTATVVCSGTLSEHTSVSPSYNKLEFSDFTSPDSITIRRRVPDLDYICERDNRLYGASNADNTIYVSELGMPTRWYGNASLSTGTFSVAVGSDGKFTGVCAFGGGVLFWKEKRLHKLLGTTPSSFYMHEYEIDGVQNGSNRSLVVMNEKLYYKGVHGVHVYTGSYPQTISYPLGVEPYTKAVGGTDGVCYHICMRDGQGKSHLYSYDTIHGLWICKGEANITAFATVGTELYSLQDLDGHAEIICGTALFTDGAWSATLLPFDEGNLIHKGYSALVLRLDMDRGATLFVDVRADGGNFMRVCTVHSYPGRLLSVPLRLHRCDTLTVRLSGIGKTTVRGMTRKIIIGSEKR